MECNVPTDIVFSFTGFAMRGGKTGPHADGWGLALYDGRFARSFLEPTPACPAPGASSSATTRSRRCSRSPTCARKTRGRASLENTHPFKRVLWGRHWVFAHNGTLPNVKRRRSALRAPDRRDRQRARLLLDARAAARRLSRRLSARSRGAVERHRRARRRRSAPKGSSTSCSPTAATCSRAAGPSSATSSARRRSAAPRCATPRCGSTSRR